MTTTEKMLSAKKAITKENLSYDELMKFEDNDFGNAQRFLKFANGKVLYDSMSSKWHLFGEGRWKQDNERKERVRKLASDMYSFLLEGLKEEYQGLEAYGVDVLNGNARDIDSTDVEEDQLTEIYAQLKQCRKERNIVLKLGNNNWQNRVIKSAEAQLVDDVIKLNPHNHYLVVANGTVNLVTGELLDHNPEQYSTMRVPVAYNPKAEEPTRFLQFLEEIFDGNRSLIAYVQKLLGYCLTGNTTQHEFYIFHGAGGNGKSVLINLLKGILGEYAGEISAGALAHSTDGDKPNPTLLQAKDCRMLITNESDKGARLNDSLIKQISAGDEICPRSLRKVNEHFVPHMKIVWVTNHIPKIDWNDGGINRRIQLVPFSVNIPKEKEDKHLPETLWDEREGVLKWMIEGAKAYYEADGLGDVPEVMKEAKRQARYEEDSIYDFFKNAVIATGKKADRYKSRCVYGFYTQHCTDNGIQPESEKKFGLRFPQLIQGTSIKKDRSSSGVYYQGLKLLLEDADNDVVA